MEAKFFMSPGVRYFSDSMSEVFISGSSDETKVDSFWDGIFHPNDDLRNKIKINFIVECFRNSNHDLNPRQSCLKEIKSLIFEKMV